MMAGLRVAVIVVVVVLVDFVDQPEALEMHSRRGGQPDGHQQQRDDAPSTNHALKMRGIDATSWAFAAGAVGEIRIRERADRELSAA